MTSMPDPERSDKAQAFLDGLIDNPPRAQMGLEPGDLQGAVRAARNALETGDLVTGLYQFANLVILDATEIDHHIGLAEAALLADMNEMAMVTAATVMVLDPRRPEGYLLSGRAALALGETEAAVEDLTDAVAMAEGAMKDFARDWLQRARATEPVT